MENPDKKRPDLPQVNSTNLFSEIESFQNRVLRPIIKMQSDLLMAHTIDKLRNLKSDWNKVTTPQRREILVNMLTKDQAFRREIVGIVIGHFSLEEHKLYCQIHKEASKRITQIVLNRSLDILLNSPIE